MFRNHVAVSAITCIILSFSILGTSGCNDSQANVNVTNNLTWPKQLIFSFTSSTEDETERRFDAYSELAEHLTQELGIPVTILKTLSYAPVIEAMRAGKVDIANSGGSFSYMIAREKAGVEPIVVRGTPEGPGLYKTMLVTSPKTGLNSLEEVLAKSKDLTLAFVDPASTSGHLVPLSALQNMGVEVNKDFKQVVFTMNHTNMAMTVLSAKVDVGAMGSSSYDRLIQRGKMKPEDLKVLWQSPIIPQGPVMVRKELPADLKQAIQAAFMSINNNPNLLKKLASLSSKNEVKYYLADDSMWDGLREIARNADGFEAMGDW
jgi:phosphonate transport system substrate-binding protein